MGVVNAALAWDVVSRCSGRLGLAPDATPIVDGIDPRLSAFVEANATAIAWGVVAWRDGLRWKLCGTCREPALVPKGEHKRACRLTPRCKGKLDDLARLPVPEGSPTCARRGCERAAHLVNVHDEYLCRGCFALAAAMLDERMSANEAHA